MISRAHKFAETVIAGIISVDMTKKKYPRGKNTPLNRTRGKAWVSVFRGLYSFNDNQSFCTWINDINDNISSESSVFISKNPKESIRKWTNDIQAPGFEVLEQASIYVAEDFGLVESNLLGYSYLFGPSRLFLGLL